MLLGVLVDVIGAVASTEKQKIEITFIAAGVTDPTIPPTIGAQYMAISWRSWWRI